MSELRTRLWPLFMFHPFKRTLRDQLKERLKGRISARIEASPSVTSERAKFWIDLDKAIDGLSLEALDAALSDYLEMAQARHIAILKQQDDDLQMKRAACDAQRSKYDALCAEDERMRVVTGIRAAFDQPISDPSVSVRTRAAHGMGLAIAAAMGMSSIQYGDAAKGDKARQERSPDGAWFEPAGAQTA